MWRAEASTPATAGDQADVGGEDRTRTRCRTPPARRARAAGCGRGGADDQARDEPLVDRGNRALSLSRLPRGRRVQRRALRPPLVREGVAPFGVTSRVATSTTVARRRAWARAPAPLLGSRSGVATAHVLATAVRTASSSAAAIEASTKPSFWAA